MKFIGQSPQAQHNIITDGQLEMSYQELPDLFERLHSLFLAHEIDPKTGLIFECVNSVPHAFILLYLFEYGYDFLLVPPNSLLPKNGPQFCRYKVTAAETTATGQLSALNLAELLLISDNDSFQATLTPPQDAGESTSAKLYLRTSGSTGSPKMTVHRHDKFRKNTLNCVARLELMSSDRVVIPVPLFHMYGLGAGFMPSVAAQASIDLQKGTNILRYLGRERAFNPNVTFLTPIFCETMLKGRRSPRPYRLTVSAGDRFRGDTFKKYEAMFGCLVNLYGSTEMGAMSAASPHAPIDIRATTAGYPMSGVQFRLEERDGDEADSVGQLWCRHDAGSDKYVDNAGQMVVWHSAETDGWFFTKDLGRILSDGSIQVIGRGDHSVNRDGLLVFFADIEKTIELLETIETAIVVAKGESTRGKGLTVYCIPAKGTTVTEADIRQICFDRLPARAIPDNIIITSSLPALPSGKIDRQKLTEEL